MVRMLPRQFLRLTALAVVFFSITAVSQTGQTKKVFMITDMEGVDGIFNAELQCIPFQSPRFEESKKLLTGEINAAVEGFLSGGADEVTATVRPKRPSISHFPAVGERSGRTSTPSGTWPRQPSAGA